MATDHLAVVLTTLVAKPRLHHTQRRMECLRPFKRLQPNRQPRCERWGSHLPLRRGVQYVSIKYSEQLAEAGIEPSVGVLAIHTTTLSPKRSTAFTSPRLSIDEDNGATSKSRSSPRSNGSTCSTTGIFWSPSGTFLPPRPNNATTPCWTHQKWPHNLNQTVPGTPRRFKTF